MRIMRVRLRGVYGGKLLRLGRKPEAVKGSYVGERTCQLVSTTLALRIDLRAEGNRQERERDGL